MNVDQAQRSSQPQKILRLISPLMFGYLLVLTLIDQFFYPRPTLTPLYYLIMVGDALLIMALTYIPAVYRKLGKTLLPVIIVLLVIVPIIGSYISIEVMGASAIPDTSMRANPSAGPEMETLRLIPLTFIALILVAWQYRMRSVVLYCTLVTLTQGALTGIRRLRMPDLDLLPWLVVVTIQLVSFLIVGYFIHLLMKQLTAQQKALEDANARLVDYASTLEDLTISRERNAMARELHDTVAHTLSGLSVQLETTRAYLDVDPNTAKTMLDRSLRVTRSGLQDTRRALKSLRATPLDDLGLINALKDIAQNTAQRGNLQLDLHLPHYELHLSQAYEQVIYRIAQEALTNILNHANAAKIGVSLIRHDGEIHLMISDDGSGFEPEQQYGDHFGLVGMRERAELVGGEVHIKSETEKGTQVQLILRNLK